MKTKLSWPWAIAIFYICFVLLLLGYVIYSTFNHIDLVSYDYYTQEIKYQQQIDRINRTRSLKQSVEWSYDREKKIIILNFAPAQNDQRISGKIIFFRPSDANQDKTIKLKPDKNGIQLIPVNSLSEGFWRIKIFWNLNQLEFYQEGIVIIE